MIFLGFAQGEESSPLWPFHWVVLFTSQFWMKDIPILQQNKNNKFAREAKGELEGVSWLGSQNFHLKKVTRTWKLQVP